jgi:hypothetical protein
VARKIHRDRDHGFDPAQKYKEFPGARGRKPADPHGSSEGFDTWLWLNNRELFRDDQMTPALQAFCEAADVGIRVYYAQFKSSHVSSEFFIHSPQDAMTPGEVDEIDASAFQRSGQQVRRVQTLIMHHEATLAHHNTRTMAVVDDSGDAGLLVYKEEG